MGLIHLSLEQASETSEQLWDQKVNLVDGFLTWENVDSNFGRYFSVF